ncbi:hypothetical protein OS175_08085 [Marinicella sp. S1101]|uniref:hypothetical protein n=1 Tax=Marinicella marina TaxID=2996016 RepID=UPI002260A883|nr:hypothetical protein [Marinicella marina]MCX7553834.1 hypothetical protein [Marinicella marina]MDJ1140910.1 hypothetical protein [Marinicella marina]
MNKQKILSALMLISLIPMLIGLFFALHHQFDWGLLAANRKHFAWLSGYIYIHYTAAFMLALMTGIQIGKDLNSERNAWFMLLNLLLLILLWLSYRSFGDFNGVLLVFVCWLAATVIDYHAKQNDLYPSWLARNKMIYNLINLIIIGAVLLLNH